MDAEHAGRYRTYLQPNGILAFEFQRDGGATAPMSPPALESPPTRLVDVLTPRTVVEVVRAQRAAGVCQQSPAAVAPSPPPTRDDLAARRRALGLSQRDLAAAAGIARGMLAGIERGRRATTGQAGPLLLHTLLRLERKQAASVNPLAVQLREQERQAEEKESNHA